LPEAWRDISLQRGNRSLSKMVTAADLDCSRRHRDAAMSLHQTFLAYHHLVNSLSVDEWRAKFNDSGLSCEVHVLILPSINSAPFLFIDVLYHLSCSGDGEMEQMIYPFLQTIPAFPRAFRSVFSGAVGDGGRSTRL